MPELSTDVRYIKGVGEQRAKALARLGVRTLGDLLNYFPRTYEDRTAVRPIAERACAPWSQRSRASRASGAGSIS